MIISRCYTHDFLGMNIKIRKDKKLDIIMKNQIDDTVRQFNDIFCFEVNLPCAQHLWNVNDEAELLDGVKSDFFTR